MERKEQTLKDTDLPNWFPATIVPENIFGKKRNAEYRFITAKYFATLLPTKGFLSILEVGAGDGLLARFFQEYRPETQVVAIDILPKNKCQRAFPVLQYDGRHLPFNDKSFDVVVLSNVLHHAVDPAGLFNELCRVAKKKILIKDHVYYSRLDFLKLLFLDWLGNVRQGVKIRGNYFRLVEWEKIFSQTNISAIFIPSLPLRKGWYERIFKNNLEAIFVGDKQVPLSNDK